MTANVLITGGSGFLGRALAKRLLLSSARRICILSRGEYAQAQMRQEVQDPDGRMRYFIGDVRDKDRLRHAMRGIDLVIHAAALKRVEVGEYNPSEMVLTNVMGAINVVEAAMDCGVGKVIGVSSDKACAPVNCYGATKLTMEKLLLAANNAAGTGGTKFSVVRYGNVSGSTGSVIPMWRDMLRRGEKITIRHPICRRFWMSVYEAVELILWTAQAMIGGETIVPLLPAYGLDRLAEALGAGPDQIVVSELGQGEKLDEMMVAPLESPEFRYVASDRASYLVRGGLAAGINQNVSGIRTYMLTVDELRERLKEIP